MPSLLPPERSTGTGALGHGDGEFWTPRPFDAASLTTEEAIDRLAEHLYWKMEHLDPAGTPPWLSLSEREREFYRTLMRYLLSMDDLLGIALDKRSSDNGFVNRGL